MLFIRLRLLRHRRLGYESTQLYCLYRSLQRREKPDPEPIENQRRRPQPAVPRGSPAPPAAIDKSQNDRVVVGTRQETDGRGSPNS
mgnify:CR=1 FL=1